MSDFNWNNVSRNKQVISLLKEREEIENEIKAIDEFSLVKYEYEKLGLDQANEDSKETEKALVITDVSKSLIKLIKKEKMSAELRTYLLEINLKLSNVC